MLMLWNLTPIPTTQKLKMNKKNKLFFFKFLFILNEPILLIQEFFKNLVQDFKFEYFRCDNY